ncbi:hypothetical protein LTV02_23655 [Nocardia yamanashiensis]|uniref:hypothetical protein n=1 Tax=Nocardia yamanashiensis TaxID=209247 RepID=UPI001E5DA465|nr:hypothetical protein [Nocardia yamanashiensis]UGT39083.1 hypothetical protein LTV02_23655 [Nocardia yamanashiensis]
MFAPSGFGISVIAGAGRPDIPGSAAALQVGNELGEVALGFAVIRAVAVTVKSMLCHSEIQDGVVWHLVEAWIVAHRSAPDVRGVGRHEAPGFDQDAARLRFGGADRNRTVLVLLHDSVGPGDRQRACRDGCVVDGWMVEHRGNLQ